MTVIAARKTDKGVEISWDSFCGDTYRKGKVDRLSNLDKKIDGNNFKALICGSASSGSLLKFFSKHNGIESATEMDILGYLIRFKEWCREKLPAPDLNMDMIIIMDGKIFEVDADQLVVFENTEFISMGAGQQYAATALHLGHTAEDACKIACQLSNHCLEPVRTEVIKYD